MTKLDVHLSRTHLLRNDLLKFTLIPEKTKVWSFPKLHLPSEGLKSGLLRSLLGQLAVNPHGYHLFEGVYGETSSRAGHLGTIEMNCIFQHYLVKIQSFFIMLSFLVIINRPEFSSAASSPYFSHACSIALSWRVNFLGIFTSLFTTSPVTSRDCGFVLAAFWSGWWKSHSSRSPWWACPRTLLHRRFLSGAHPCYGRGKISSAYLLTVAF